MNIESLDKLCDKILDEICLNVSQHKTDYITLPAQAIHTLQQSKNT